MSDIIFDRYRRIIKAIIVSVMYLFGAATVLLVFIVYPGFNWYYKAMMGDMIYGLAHKPFVFRTLVPSTVRLLTEISPEMLEDKLVVMHDNSFTLSKLTSMADVERAYIYEYFVLLLILMICFVALALAMRRLIKYFYDFPDYIAEFAPLGCLFIIPAFFRYYNELYDPATLALFALGLLAVVRDKRLWYYALFVLAAVNKETSLLMAVPFLFYEYKQISNGRLVGHLMAQGIIWLTIRAGIMYYFIYNTGDNLYFNLFKHTLTMILRPFPLFYALLIAGIFFVLIKYKWSDKPILLRRSFLWSFYILLPLGMCFGVIDEIRIFYEIYPMAFLLALPTVVHLFGMIKKDNVISTTS